MLRYFVKKNKKYVVLQNDILQVRKKNIAYERMINKAFEH